MSNSNPQTNEILTAHTLRGELDDLIAAYTSLDHTVASLGKHRVIQVVHRAVPRLRYYAPRPLRDDAKPIQPDIYLLNWPDLRRGRASSTTRTWFAIRSASEAQKTQRRFRATALFDHTLTYETDRIATAYKWMRSQWPKRTIDHQPEHPTPKATPDPFRQRPEPHDTLTYPFRQDPESHDTFASGLPDGFTNPE